MRDVRNDFIIPGLLRPLRADHAAPPAPRSNEKTRNKLCEPHVEFLARHARRYSEKQLASLLNISVRAAQNLRLGRSGTRSVLIEKWCQNDPHFRADFFTRCGGHLECRPDIFASIACALQNVATHMEKV